MTGLQAIIYAIVAFWLAPAGLWRPVACALLVQWGVSEAIYAATGDHVPLSAYIVGDCAVIGVVMLWRSHWSDWLVIAPYPLVWWIYTLPETYGQWIALYWIAIGQFVVAGPWAQARQEATIFGDFLRDVAGFVRSRLSRVAMPKSAG